MSEGKFLGCGCWVFVVVLVLNILFGGLCTEYVVEFWGAQIKGVPIDVPFLPCAIAGLFIGEITIPAAMATWLISFVI